MKIWPFDELARDNGGRDISLEDLKSGLAPLQKIRNAVGDRMEIMVELHGLWQTLPAIRICKALEDFSPNWAEDAIRLDSLAALDRLRAATSVRLAFGETMGNQADFKRLLDTGGVDVILFDFGWSGGVSEAVKVFALAEAYGVPVAPHDCVGPVALCVGAHFSVSSSNVLIQETVRAYYSDWYNDIVDHLPIISRGQIAPRETPGLGVELLPGLTSRSDAHIRLTQ